MRRTPYGRAQQVSVGRMGHLAPGSGILDPTRFSLSERVPRAEGMGLAVLLRERMPVVLPLSCMQVLRAMQVFEAVPARRVQYS